MPSIAEQIQSAGREGYWTESACAQLPLGAAWEVNTPQTPRAEGGCLPGGVPGATAWGTKMAPRKTISRLELCSEATLGSHFRGGVQK